MNARRVLRGRRSRCAAAAGIAVTVTVTVAASLLSGSLAAGAVRTSSAGVPDTVTTIAGGVGGPGSARSFSADPCGPVGSLRGCGLAFTAGRLYFTDATFGGQDFRAGVVRSIAMFGGGLTTPAGDGLPDLAGDGGPARQAGLVHPDDVSFDHSGSMLISDSISVRVVAAANGTFYGRPMAAGHIYTVAGGGASTEDGVPATQAGIEPLSAFADQAGNLVICESSSIRVVAASSGTFYGQPMTAGDIYTVAGGGSSTSDGVAATAESLSPVSAALDLSGNVLINDRPRFSPLDRIRVLAVTTGTFYGQPMTVGDIYTVAGGGTSVSEKVPATESRIAAIGLTADAAGNIVIADFSDNLVRIVAAVTGTFYGQPMMAGDIYAVAGGGTSTRDGSSATTAALREPRAVAIDSAGNIVVASPGLRVHAVAARPGDFYGVRMLAGHLYSIAGNGQSWQAGSGGPATRAQFRADDMVAYDGSSLVVSGADTGTKNADGMVALVPARPGSYFGHRMRAGHLYVIAGTSGPDRRTRFGVPGTSSSIGNIGGLAVDAHGNVLLAAEFYLAVLAQHSGTFYGQRMKAGHLYKIAGDGSFGDSGDGGPALKAGMSPGLLLVDPHGNIVIDASVQVRLVAAHTGTFYGKAMKVGHIYTIAGNGQSEESGDGGPARDAAISQISGLAEDGKDGLLLSDFARIRMIATATGTFFGVPMVAGDIYTIAGGRGGTSPDGAPALNSAIMPGRQTMDGSGNLVFYDGTTDKIRVVPSTSGTFYGMAMTAGDLYSIAGGGIALGDGGPATRARIFGASGLAHGSHGIAYTDGGIRVRFVSG